MTRTLHIFDTVDLASGGPIASFLGMAPIFREMGIGVDVVSLDTPDSGYDRDFPFPLTMLGDGSSRRAKMFGRSFRYSSKLSPWIAERAREYDWVTLHSIWTYAVIGGAKGLRESRTPYFIFAHGMLDPWFRDTFPVKHLRKQLFWTMFLGRVLEESRGVLFTALDERELARGMFLGHNRYREIVVNLGTSQPPTASPARRAAFLSHCPGVEGRRYLLFLSRIHPKKGCDLLIRAFAEIAGEHPDLDVVMAGPDQQGWKAELETLARDLGVESRIHWPGMLTGDAKWGAFHGAEAFLLPSHQENFGVAVAESCGCGIPVLITRRINIWREIVNAGAGLAGKDTAEDTARQLREFLALDPEARMRMGLAGKALFDASFDVRTTARSCASQLTEIAAR
ncbi:MAG: glycosyltransferase [Pseudomonadota bacterium]